MFDGKTQTDLNSQILNHTRMKNMGFRNVPVEDVQKRAECEYQSLNIFLHLKVKQVKYENITNSQK